MKRITTLLVLAAVAAAVPAQISLYGNPTPPGFSGNYDSGGQLPFVGSTTFGLRLAGHPNNFGGGILFAFNAASIPVGAATLLVDVNGAVILDLPPFVTQISLPIPAFAGFVGYTGFTQAGVFDPGILGGFGLTNGVQVTVLPNLTPSRAYLPGQNFAGGPGFMAVLDVSVQPPAFRATGTVSLNGNITNDFPSKIAVADIAQIAYALGNSLSNQFVRVFNVAADPAGVVAHVNVGDIPIAGEVTSIVGGRDMEAMSNGQYLFVTSGSSTVNLQVFDVSNVPFSLPTSAIQTITFPNAGSGAVGLRLSPAEDRLAVVVSDDASSTVTLYAISVGAPQPLTALASMTLGAFSGPFSPSDLDFAPDGRLLFVSGSNGFFNVIDTQPVIPTILIGAGTWPNVAANLWCHGSAIAVQNGLPVAILGGEGATGLYHLVDLNDVSPTFGSVVSSFTTNVTPGNANISNHRIHARQNIVVAIDGTGATADCQWVDVIDLNQPIPGGYQSWRVRMPTSANLTPGNGSAIPRDFDLF